jgi:hypothetical protein
MYIKPDKNEFDEPYPDSSKAMLVILYVLPVIALASVVSYKNRDILLHYWIIKKSDPYNVARMKIKLAKKELHKGNSATCSSILDSAITGYVNHKLRLDRATANSSIYSQISVSPIPKDLSDRIIHNLQFLEFTRFSSSGQTQGIDENMIKEISEIITLLRKAEI